MLYLTSVSNNQRKKLHSKSESTEYSNCLYENCQYKMNLFAQSIDLKKYEY